MTPRREALRGTALLLACAALTALTALVALPPVESRAGAPSARLYVVQAVPGASYAVSVDGQEKQADAAVGAVLGPFDVTAGRHAVEFASGSGAPLTTQVEVRGGVDSDLVLHLPAERGGDPVADVYRADGGAVAAGMARVLVAHTATVPPADVRVDGTTVFRDIANGEFAVADVPAGRHRAAIVAAGTTSRPILGPIDVDLPAGTLTMVYAVGRPSNGSMDVISHQEPLRTTTDVRPSRIHTGSAGLVRGWSVLGFGPS